MILMRFYVLRCRSTKRKDIPLSTKHLFVIAEKINIDLVNRNRPLKIICLEGEEAAFPTFS